MKPTATIQRALRRSLRLPVCAAWWALCVAAMAPLWAAAQGPPPNPVRVYTGQPDGQSADASPGDATDGSLIENEKRLRALNADRQKSLVSDAAKLLKLAQQLNAELAQSPADELTPAQVRKMAEIEKLARSVKAKMSTSVRGLAPSETPFVQAR